MRDGLPLVHQSARMRTEFSAPYSGELWRHQHVAITVERDLRCKVTRRNSWLRAVRPRTFGITVTYRR
jgi:hypothetical protein